MAGADLGSIRPNISGFLDANQSTRAAGAAMERVGQNALATGRDIANRKQHRADKKQQQKQFEAQMALRKSQDAESARRFDAQMGLRQQKAQDARSATILSDLKEREAEQSAAQDEMRFALKHGLMDANDPQVQENAAMLGERLNKTRSAIEGHQTRFAQSFGSQGADCQPGGK